LAALELAVLVQPEIEPVAGGVARSEPGSVVTVEGVRGHPGPLLSGWAEGARDAELAALIGAETVADVTGLARRVHDGLGDDVIEWAVCDGKAWLLQCFRSAPPSTPPTNPAATSIPPDFVAPAANGHGMLALATLIQERGTRMGGQPAAPGTATGRLLRCRAHETVDCRDAILLVDRPLPALAPLLFGARGVISRAGAAGSHLAEVARSLGVPMVTGCRPETVTGPEVSGWSATVNGTTGEVTLLADRISPARGRRRPRRGVAGGGLPARPL
jgi:phosphohistidine swiveling domain-containing protein